jgi:hypothetical protein
VTKLQNYPVGDWLTNTQNFISSKSGEAHLLNLVEATRILPDSRIAANFDHMAI